MFICELHSHHGAKAGLARPNQSSCCSDTTTFTHMHSEEHVCTSVAGDHGMGVSEVAAEEVADSVRQLVALMVCF